MEDYFYPAKIADMEYRKVCIVIDSSYFEGGVHRYTVNSARYYYRDVDTYMYRRMGETLGYRRTLLITREIKIYTKRIHSTRE